MLSGCRGRWHPAGGRMASTWTAPTCARRCARSAGWSPPPARLQAGAEAGTVLGGAPTVRLVEPMFAWDDERALDLAGKSGPTVARRVVAVSGEAGRRRGLGVHAPLVGRERELAAAR